DLRPRRRGHGGLVCCNRIWYQGAAGPHRAEGALLVGALRSRRREPRRRDALPADALRLPVRHQRRAALSHALHHRRHRRERRGRVRARRSHPARDGGLGGGVRKDRRAVRDARGPRGGLGDPRPRGDRGDARAWTPADRRRRGARRDRQRRRHGDVVATPHRAHPARRDRGLRRPEGGVGVGRDPALHLRRGRALSPALWLPRDLRDARDQHRARAGPPLPAGSLARSGPGRARARGCSLSELPGAGNHRRGAVVWMTSGARAMQPPLEARMRRTLILALGALCALVAMSGVALAKEGAVTKFDSPPGEWHAGQNYTLGYTIRMDGVEPYKADTTEIVIRNGTGKVLSYPGTPDGTAGHYTAKVY